MEKILVKYNKLRGKDSITEVIPGCVTRTRIDISRDVRKEVLLMEDGSLKTDILELAAWKDIVSLHFLGHAIAGLSSNGSIRFFVANPRMQYKSNKEEWAEIWESLRSVDNIKQLIVWGSPYGTSTSGPFAVGLNYNGKLWLAGDITVIGITSEKWSGIERLFDVWGGVLAERKDRTLVGSGRFSSLTGKRLASEKPVSNDHWYLENNEVAYIFPRQNTICVLNNVSKIIKYSSIYFDYSYLTCDGMVFSKHFDYFYEDKDTLEKRKDAVDILTFGDEGKYLAVLYRNGEVRIFINTKSEDEANAPLNDNPEFVFDQNYRYYSGDAICKNAKSLRFEEGKLIAEVDDAITPLEINQGNIPSANREPDQKAQKSENECNKYQWVPFEQSDEYQRYYDKLYGLIEPEIGKTEKISSYLHRDCTLTSFDGKINTIVSSLKNVSCAYAVKNQETLAVQHSQSITFITKRYQSGSIPFVYETVTLNDVQSMHLFDQDRSLFVKFSDGRYLSVGRVFFSSCTTREPHAYCLLSYREGTRSRNFRQDDYGIAGITKDNKPFVLSDKLGFLISHVLLLENENNILDCAKANMVENKRFCFLRQDGTVLTLDSHWLTIASDMRRRTSIRYWKNVRKLISNDDRVSAIEKDNRFVMVAPSKSNQSVLDEAMFVYWVPVEDEEGDKGETIYENETASVVLYLDGTLKVSGESKLLPFYPLPLKSGIRRLLRNDKYFFVLAEDGILWCSKARFDPAERYQSDETLELKRKFTKWGQVRKGIVDIVNRGDTVYLKIQQEKFNIINQGDGDRVTPITDPEMLDFLSSQEYESIAGIKSIHKEQFVTDKLPDIEELQDNLVAQANAEKSNDKDSEAAADEIAGEKTTKQKENEAAPPAEESAEKAKATANTYGPFQYKPCYIDGMGVEITDYTGTEGQVVIPAEIEGQPVLAINLSHNSNIESIELPEGMRTIGYSAFSSCPNLCSISIPSTVDKIDDRAFWNCKKLEEIALPEKINSVGDAVFFGCSSLQSINIAGHSDYYITINGVLIRRKDQCLIAYPAAKKDALYQIPPGIERISEKAFAQNVYLRTVLMPDSLCNIEKDAFWECAILVKVVLSEALNSIVEGCFKYCKNLSSIELPKGITTIEKSAFLGCKSLSLIAFPSGLESIQTQAFQSCENLTSIALPNSLKVLEGDAFYMCSKLVSITLPPNLETVYKKSFPRNKHLSMVVPKNSPMEAWVKEKGYQYTTTSQISDSYYSTERIAGSYEETLRRAKDLMADAQATIAKLHADNALKEKKSTRIVELDKEILELSEELKALTGWFKGKQRRELQERIEVKKAELERLRG